MFSSLGLLRDLPCPDRPHCARIQCLFSHDPNATAPTPIPIIVQPTPLDHLVRSPLTSPPNATPAFATSSSSAVSTRRPQASMHSPSRSASTSKRAAITPPSPSQSEPPRKLQKLSGPSARPAVPTATASYSASGAPLLKVNAAQSKVALPVRQTMLKSLYDHFIVLYQDIYEDNPTLAAEHALQQEDEVYQRSAKLTYRNAVINSIVALKKRPPPTHSSHPSVGTEATIRAREEHRKTLAALRLTPALLEPLILADEEMKLGGYVLDVPKDVVGGEAVSEVGGSVKCERCGVVFLVKAMEEPDGTRATDEECSFHWGRPYTQVVGGEKVRQWRCCGRPTSDKETCERGRHVFYERGADKLHRRHAFTHSRPAPANSSPRAVDTVLDVAALDCEMVYSTAGMSIARVSIVDGCGTEVFDQLVRMDDGVDVIDYNTRFSGIKATDHAAAALPLSSIRVAMDALIDANTILIGHALENDLKALRMLHRRCVDTAYLYPHQSGLPYRRALRDLAKQHLQRSIQTGGATVGHSSLEDAIATLDLVRAFIMGNKNTKPVVVKASSKVNTSSATSETPAGTDAASSSVLALTSDETPSIPSSTLATLASA